MTNENVAIIFVHGLFRPPSLLGSSTEYFRNLKPELASLSIPMYFPDLPNAESLKIRSKALTTVIEAVPEDKIILIGHSMGGLDSRYYAHMHPEDKRIKKIITIATPHRGSLFADWVMHGRSWLARIFRYQFGNSGDDLTIAACAEFNKKILDRADIEYSSYAASRPNRELPFWLRWIAKHIGEEANDGQVPVSSAHWGHFVGVLHADHFETTGWSLGLSSKREQRPFNYVDFYRRLVVTESKAITGN
ncbi:MAG: alpha/beta fold hydrolase [Sulfuriflexus sp.]|nr:alpha/beta fold hydrolase [Sulfuriflexus sp.]